MFLLFFLPSTVLKCSHVSKCLFEVPHRDCRCQCKPVWRTVCNTFYTDHDAVKTGKCFSEMTLSISCHKIHFCRKLSWRLYVHYRALDEKVLFFGGICGWSEGAKYVFLNLIATVSALLIWFNLRDILSTWADSWVNVNCVSQDLNLPNFYRFLNFWKR